MVDSPTKNIRGGYSYSVTDDQICDFLKLSVGERLRWIEESQEFFFKTLPPTQWEILQKFRRGEL